MSEPFGAGPARAYAREWLLALCLAATLLACQSEQRYAVVTVEDPLGAAQGATSLRYGADLEALRTLELKGRGFRLTFGLTHDTDAEVALWVEAWTSGQRLARGKTLVSFVRGRTGAAHVTLRLPCDSAADCPDEAYCDGASLCEERMCGQGPPPCAPSFDCVINTCVEDARACSISVDHSVCTQEGGPNFYCNPSVGCAEAPPCLPNTGDEDCQDESACNGRERCINFHCVAGTTPTVSDDDPVCTLDGCDDTRAAAGLDPFFHYALAEYNGLPCALTDGSGEVCVSSLGGCVPSSCGDGVRFDEEVCDDGPANSASWALDAHCSADCTGPAPYCGDDVVQVPEECDDGVRADTGNGCDSSCRTYGSCGDGVTQALFEECDDGAANVDECDGCKTDCSAACICNSTQRCPDRMWCGADAACVACNTKERCGAECQPCGYAERCDETRECRACSDVAHCGPTCTACVAGSATPDCGGPLVGCVTDSCDDQPDFTRCLALFSSSTYDICSGGLCVEPGACADASCNAPGPHFALPDSGVRACYDDTTSIPCPPLPCGAGDAYCGQDADYGWDTTHSAAERFTKRLPTGGLPLVDDNVTGLTWQGCTAGLSGASCQLGGGSSKTNWYGALAYCNGLDWGGERGWRLPDRFELQSLVDASPGLPTIDDDAFPNTTFGHYWSSSVAQGNNTNAWSVSFANAFTQDTYSKNFPFNDVRCVRGGSSVALGPRFARTTPVVDEPMVSDNVTGLVWHGCPAGKATSACTGTSTTTSWQQALSYCQALTWAGHEDWRLPHAMELSSLVDDRRWNPSIDPLAFPGTDGAAFWTSTTEGGGATSAFAVEFRDGTTGPWYKNVIGGALVRCVRGP